MGLHTSQFVSLIWWWLLAVVIGWLAWPLTFRLLRFVPDRGYALTRPMGLLLSAYLWWLLGSLGFLDTSLGSLILALVLTSGLAIWFYQTQRSNDPTTPINWLRKNLSYVLVHELVFLVAFVGWALFRAHSPAIHHTEKPMEFAFLNGILRSPGFPPSDPWLSGYGISYYYEGYVMMALLTRISGTAPGIAYNIGHALWFALSVAGAFGVGYNLTQAGRQNKALAYGLLAALLLMVMGNLGGTLELAHQNNVGSPGFWKWLDVADLSGPPSSGGGFTPQRGGWWWWRASRVINDYVLNGGSQHDGTTVIDEFPQFSFILGDMHPHVLGLPFALLAILLAFNLYRADSTLTAARLKLLEFKLPFPSFPIFLVYALALGALGFLNTLDYPTYLALTTSAFGLRRWKEMGSVNRALILDTVSLGAGLGLASLVLYLPFYLSYESHAQGIFPNLFYGTRFSQFFVMFGPFLVVGACFISSLARRRHPRLWVKALSWAAIAIVICLALLLPVGLASSQGRTYLRAWLQGQPLPGLDQAQAGSVVASRLAGRWLGTSTATLRPDGTTLQVPGSGPWVPLFGALIVTVAVLLWRASFSRRREPQQLADRLAPTALFVLLLFAMGAAIVLGVEFVFLRDAFNNRANTVFKFYYQVWILWSLASAYGVYYVMEDPDHRQGTIARTVQTTLIAVLILAGLTYPIMAIPTRMGEAALSLDGTAYLARESPAEYQAIQWLNANVTGVKVLLEAPGDSFQADTARVSGYTGLPTLLGWRGHESQWRRDFGPIAVERESAIQEIYGGRDTERTLALLDQFDITYVYVGPRERFGWPDSNLEKLDRLMHLVYDREGIKIYQRRETPWEPAGE